MLSLGFVRHCFLGFRIYFYSVSGLLSGRLALHSDKPETRSPLRIYNLKGDRQAGEVCCPSDSKADLANPESFYQWSGVTALVPSSAAP